MCLLLPVNSIGTILKSVCVCVCVRACVHACMHACVFMCNCVQHQITLIVKREIYAYTVFLVSVNS